MNERQIKVALFVQKYLRSELFDMYVNFPSLVVAQLRADSHANGLDFSAQEITDAITAWSHETEYTTDGETVWYSDMICPSHCEWCGKPADLSNPLTWKAGQGYKHRKCLTIIDFQEARYQATGLTELTV